MGELLSSQPSFSGLVLPWVHAWPLWLLCRDRSGRPAPPLTTSRTWPASATLPMSRVPVQEERGPLPASEQGGRGPA